MRWPTLQSPGNAASGSGSVVLGKPRGRIADSGDLEIMLHYTTLCYIVLYYNISYYIDLYYIIVYYIIEVVIRLGPSPRLSGTCKTALGRLFADPNLQAEIILIIIMILMIVIITIIITTITQLLVILTMLVIIIVTLILLLIIMKGARSHRVGDSERHCPSSALSTSDIIRVLLLLLIIILIQLLLLLLLIITSVNY